MEQTRIKLGNGIELDVVDQGPRDAPVLIFLHGFPESHRTWRHQIAHLSGRFRCIAPDQRGYRGSSKPQDVASYATGLLIGDVFQLADAMGVDQFTVVGHDWGGVVAWGAALLGQANGRVTRVVIANAPHPLIFQKLLYTDPQQRAASQYVRTFRDPAIDAMLRENGLTGLLANLLNSDKPSAMEPEERSALLADWQDPDASFGMLNWYRASKFVVPPMDEPFAVPASYTPPSLPDLKIPTLVIWAMDDLALPASNLDGLDAIIPDLTLVQVPDCGHFVTWEAPQAVNAALDAFFARTTSAA